MRKNGENGKDFISISINDDNCSVYLIESIDTEVFLCLLFATNTRIHSQDLKG